MKRMVIAAAIVLMTATFASAEDTCEGVILQASTLEGVSIGADGACWPSASIPNEGDMIAAYEEGQSLADPDYFAVVSRLFLVKDHHLFAVHLYVMEAGEWFKNKGRVWRGCLQLLHPVLPPGRSVPVAQFG